MHAPDPPMRSHLVDVALHLFAKRGYTQTSLREIADRAGVSHSSIQYHFGTKDALYRETLKRINAEGLGAECPRIPAVGEMTSTEAVELLHRWVLAIATVKSRLGEREHAALSYLEDGGKPGSPPNAAFYRKVIDPGHEAVKRLISAMRPDISDEMALEVLAFNVIAQCVMLRAKRGILLKRLGKRSVSDDDAAFIARCISEVAVRGILDFEQ
ncbi:MAG: CerR family C-terminal domain-containing protein [Planctomycetota bacterium]